MKKNFALLAITFLMTTFQSTALAENYDNPAWETFFSGQAIALPEGLPTGEGAVMAKDRNKPSMKNDQTIDRPFNMATEKKLIFTQTAKTDKMTYAGQIMKDFLLETQNIAEQLSGQKNFALPIGALATVDDKYPCPHKSSLMTVTLGNLETKEGHAILADGLVIQDGTNLIKAVDSPHVSDELACIEYSKLARKQAMTLDGANEQDKKSMSLEIYRTARQKLQDKKKLNRLNKKNIKNTRDSKLKVLKEKNQAKQLERDEALEKIAALPLEKQDEALDAFYDSFTKKNMEDAVQLPLTQNQLDLASMWFIVEAALTQKTAEIYQISMPAMTKVLMLRYAKSQNRPEAIVQMFDDITQPGRDSIQIELTCGIRDRFLGCLNSGASPNIARTSNIHPTGEEKVTQMAKNLIQLSEKAPAVGQMNAIKMLQFAKPYGVDGELQAWKDSGRAGAPQAQTLLKWRERQEERDTLKALPLEERRARMKEKMQKRNRQ